MRVRGAASIAAVVAVLVAVVAAAVQLTSYALFGSVAAQPSIPALVTAAWPFDLLPEAGHARPAFINMPQGRVEFHLLERARCLPGIALRWQHRVIHPLAFTMSFVMTAAPIAMKS